MKMHDVPNHIITVRLLWGFFGCFFCFLSLKDSINCLLSILLRDKMNILLLLLLIYIKVNIVFSQPNDPQLQKLLQYHNDLRRNLTECKFEGQPPAKYLPDLVSLYYIIYYMLHVK